MPSWLQFEAGVVLALIVAFIAAYTLLRWQIRTKNQQLSQKNLELEFEVGERRRADDVLRRGEMRVRRQNAALARLARMDTLTQGERASALQSLTAITADALEIERSSIWLFDEEQASIVCVDLYERTPGRHSAGSVLKEADYPSYFVAMKKDHTIAAHEARTDHRTREFTQAYLDVIGIASMLDAPIRVGGRMVGVCCNEHVGEARNWSIDEQNFAGAVADFTALILETSERLRAEDDLRRNEGYFRSIISNAMDAVVSIDRDGRIIGWNPQAVITFGWQAEEAMGQDLGKLIVPPSHRAEHTNGVKRFASTGRLTVANQVREMSAIHRTGREFPIEVILTSTQVRDEDVVTAFIRDITERKRSEEERIRLLSIQQELDVASHIQQSFLPRAFPEFPGAGRVDVHATMIPAKVVAGDFYDYFALDDQRLAFVIGDVSGKGVPAAIFMAACRTFLKAIAKSSESPGDCLTQLNTMLCADNVAEMFVTLAYGILDTETGLFTYSLAGHPSPIVILREGAARPVEIAGGTILGVFPHTLYTDATARLAPGDGLFLYTDGVTESMDEDRIQFGEGRLQLHLGGAPSMMPIRELVKSVNDELDRHANGAQRHDDTTILALRYLPDGGTGIAPGTSA